MSTFGNSTNIHKNSSKCVHILTMQCRSYFNLTIFFFDRRFLKISPNKWEKLIIRQSLFTLMAIFSIRRIFWRKKFRILIANLRFSLFKKNCILFEFRNERALNQYLHWIIQRIMSRVMRRDIWHKLQSLSWPKARKTGCQIMMVSWNLVGMWNEKFNT